MTIWSEEDLKARRLLIAIFIEHPNESRVTRCYEWTTRRTGLARIRPLRWAVNAIGDRLDRKEEVWREATAQSPKSMNAVLSAFTRWQRVDDLPRRSPRVLP